VKGAAYAEAWLRLVFLNEPMAGLGLPGSPEAGVLVFSLHSADPGAQGDRSAHQVSYAGYAPVMVARGAQSFEVVAQAGVAVRAALIADVDFGKRSDAGPAVVASHFAISDDAGLVLYRGTNSPAMQITQGSIPRLERGTEVSEE
jgi:hypothetical protein